MDEEQQQLHRVIELGNIDTQSLLLGGEKQFYVNSLSTREMESLTALCDTFLPSVPTAAADDSTAAFYRSSASMAGTPERIGGMISERIEHPRKWLLRLSLFLLSTWIGTLIMCGLPSISFCFPFIQSFSQLSLHKREQILHSWSRSLIPQLSTLFKTLKMLTLLVYFSQVDERNENLTWRAIGYPGPDPELKPQTRQPKTLRRCMYDEEQVSENNGKDENIGPLCRGLINLNLPSELVADSLRKSGFPVSVRHRRIKHNAATSPSLVIQCDAVVVGSGSGGGVVAGVLAKAGYKVLVVEKGNYFARSNLSLLEGPSMDQMYLSSGLAGTVDMGVVILAGSTVGGGSTVNWSASIRTPQHVINEWSEELQLELFSSKLYREALDVVCERMGVQSEINDEGLNNAVLRKGCEELGYPVMTIPRNSTADHYCGWCSLGCKDGKKKGTCETWLVDLISSGNGAILPECEVTKVLHKQNRGKSGRRIATGVAFQFGHKGAKDWCVVEAKVTIVAGGALSTPPLLKASGLKNPNIGKNLHLHPVTMAWGYFPPTPTSWPEEYKMSYEGGIMTAMSPVVANWDESGYGALIQTPSLHPGMFSSLIPWVSGSDLKNRMCRFSRTAHVFALSRDKGSGTVQSPTSISYQLSKSDEENLKKGIEMTLRIMAAAGAEEIGTHNAEGKRLNVKTASYREFDRFVVEESRRSMSRSQICSAHQMGSCRMGIDEKESAVKETGETWEVEGLFVADSSVFPTALGVNPMVTVQAIAYCTAQSALEVLKRKKHMNKNNAIQSHPNRAIINYENVIH